MATCPGSLQGKRQRSLAMQAALLTLQGTHRRHVCSARCARWRHMLPPRRCSGPKRLFSSQRICAGKRYRAVMLTC
ncbi:conserved hypothetical protein [Xanthomonas citri pv. bilvae]|nr:conserved hypothetical protein [Xanthomonas citri pv. bilvae]